MRSVKLSCVLHVEKAGEINDPEWQLGTPLGIGGGKEATLFISVS